LVGDDKEYGHNNHLLRSIVPCCCFLVGVGYENKLTRATGNRKESRCEGVKQTLSSSASCRMDPKAQDPRQAVTNVLPPWSSSTSSSPRLARWPPWPVGSWRCPHRAELGGHRLCCPIAPPPSSLCTLLPPMLLGRSMLMPHMTQSLAPDAEPRAGRCTAGKTTPTGT
jgi:hypothetical protein